ncbi:MAG TPA: BTAD domain-containing putative transcriptional regulator, partial [Longimicrobiales bacterium]|nr:BTAD domain-containing putative transcriptional regulator [Longimicrobiales bacterium]
LARGAAGRGDARGAAGWWRRLAAHDPLNAGVAEELMNALVAAGDRAGALQHARIYEALVQQELDLPSDHEVVSLAERLRRDAEEPARPVARARGPEVSEVAASSTGAVAVPGIAASPTASGDGLVVAPYPAPTPAPADLPPAGTRSDRWRRTPRAAGVMLATALVVLVVVAVLALYRQRSSGRAGDDGLLAVGLISDYRSAGAPDFARPLADLLATNLARVPGMNVVSTARMYELAARLSPATPGSAEALIAAAQQAGASGLIDGALYALPDGRLRLDLRRIELGGGAVRAAYSVSGSDIFALVDSGTAQLASGAGLAPPSGTVADVTTRSEVAYRLYTQGLREFQRGSRAGAERLFEAALAEDSTFAMAAYHLARSGPGRRSQLMGNFDRALRLADRASDRERLIIRAGWAAAASDPALLPIAETLSVRYPQELEGHYYAGRALLEAGEYAAAIGRLRRVLAMDSLALRGTPGGRCTACDAVGDIITAYASSDSLDAAARWAERWVRWQPQSAVAWQRLREVRIYGQQPEPAMQAYRRAAELDPSLERRTDLYAYHYLYGGDFTTAERAFREAAATGPPEGRLDAHWYLTISLRMQGRFRDALDNAGHYRRLATQLESGARDPGHAALQQAQVLFEWGRHVEALALFDSISVRWIRNEVPSYRARHRIWALTHGANALAALRDTARLRARVDTLRALGTASALARDRRLYRHVEGLLFAVRGQDERAVTAFRSAIVSPNLGYTRTNLELARALLRLGRSPEAVATLQAALRSSLEGPSLYVTRTELHAALGDAWLAAGGRDSAAVHHREAVRAWSNADSVLGPRVASMRR